VFTDVIHTVGPRGEQPKMLHSCYYNCLQKMLKLQQKTIVSLSLFSLLHYMYYGLLFCFPGVAPGQAGSLKCFQKGNFLNCCILQALASSVRASVNDYKRFICTKTISFCVSIIRLLIDIRCGLQCG